MAVQQVMRWSIVLLLVTCCMNTRLEAQPRFEVLSTWGGPVADFQRVVNVGYAAIGQRLVIFDMTNEANIQELSSVMMTGPAESVAVRGNYAYVGGWFVQGRLLAVDISNPSQPVVTWREYVANGQTPSFGSVQHIAFYNNMLLAHNRTLGDDPVAYDITNPAVPVAIPNGANGYAVTFFDSVGAVAYPPRDFQIVGDLVYVATRRARTTIAIFNMQPDPMHPTYVGRLTNSVSENASGYRIAVEGNRAVVQVNASAGRVVRYVDVTNPASPVLRSSDNDLGYARDVAIQGNLAFVADWAGGINTQPQTANWARLKGLGIYDISNFASPVLLGTYNTPHSSIQGVSVSGNRAYLMCDGQGLVVLDVSNPANPVRLGGHYAPGQLRHLTKDGNRMYVADAWNGFTILDVSNPNVTPPVIGVYRGVGSITNQQHRKVAVRGNLAYLAAGNGGIQIVDVSNPANPTMVFHYPTNHLETGRVEGVELVGNVLHTGQAAFEPYCVGGPGFFSYDISNPAVVAPIVGSHGCMMAMHRLATKGGVTFAGGGGGGNATLCVDTSVPSAVTVNTRDWGGDDMKVQGDLLYVANSLSDAPGVSIVDVTNPFLPERLGFWPQIGDSPTRSVAVSGSRAFAGTQFTVDALDVSNPSDPQAVGRSWVGGAAELVAEGDLVYSTYFGIGSSNPAGPFLIRRYTETLACGTADYNGDGDFGTDADIEAFFACLAGQCCPTCYAGASDFNADGDFGTDADIESFFRVLAGQPC